MQNVHIVTDSCAHFANARAAEQYPLTIVPNKIRIAGDIYREGVDIGTDEALRLLETQENPPVVTSPSEHDYREVYDRLARSYDVIVSIHPSRQLFASWQNAMAAARQLMGHSKIVVIDSETLSAGQAMLVRAVVNAIEETDDFDTLVRKVRGTVERIYTVYYIESIEYLLQNNIMSTSHIILGNMLGIKPILTVEEGLLRPIEKVRTRGQAIDRLVEFVTEFTDIEEAVILQHRAYMTEQTRLLQDRLVFEFPGHYFPYMTYGPSLAALIGPGATGLVVLESEFSDDDPD